MDSESVFMLGLLYLYFCEQLAPQSSPHLIRYESCFECKWMSHRHLICWSIKMSENAHYSYAAWFDVPYWQYFSFLERGSLQWTQLSLQSACTDSILQNPCLNWGCCSFHDMLRAPWLQPFIYSRSPSIKQWEKWFRWWLTSHHHPPKRLKKQSWVQAQMWKPLLYYYTSLIY